MSNTTITAVRTTLLEVPWAGAAPAAGIIPPSQREFLILEIETAGGITGMGYLQPLSGGLYTLDACMKEMIAPKIIGLEATEVEGIWQMLWQSTYWVGRGGLATWALSAVRVVGYCWQAR